jgi:hypothetical protein
MICPGMPAIMWRSWRICWEWRSEQSLWDREGSRPSSEIWMRIEKSCSAQAHRLIIAKNILYNNAIRENSALDGRSMELISIP